VVGELGQGPCLAPDSLLNKLKSVFWGGGGGVENHPSEELFNAATVRPWDLGHLQDLESRR